MGKKRGKKRLNVENVNDKPEIRTDTCAHCGSHFYRGNEGVPCDVEECRRATCTDSCVTGHQDSHKVLEEESSDD